MPEACQRVAGGRSVAQTPGQHAYRPTSDRGRTKCRSHTTRPFPRDPASNPAGASVWSHNSCSLDAHGRPFAPSGGVKRASQPDSQTDGFTLSRPQSPTPEGEAGGSRGREAGTQDTATVPTRRSGSPGKPSPTGCGGERPTGCSGRRIRMAGGCVVCAGVCGAPSGSGLLGMRIRWSSLRYDHRLLAAKPPASLAGSAARASPAAVRRAGISSHITRQPNNRRRGLADQAVGGLHRDRRGRRSHIGLSCPWGAKPHRHAHGARGVPVPHLACLPMRHNSGISER